MISVEMIDCNRTHLRIKGDHAHICVELEILITALLDDGLPEDLLVEVAANAVHEHSKHKNIPLTSIINAIKEASDKYGYT